MHMLYGREKLHIDACDDGYESMMTPPPKEFGIVFWAQPLGPSQLLPNRHGNILCMRRYFGAKSMNK